MMVVTHLAASPFIGGPESQMLGLIGRLPSCYRSVVLSFSEGGRCHSLLDAARGLGVEAIELRHNAPHYCAVVGEIAGHLRRLGAGVVFCHGYKPDILGFLAARRVGAAVVSIAHGWTAATWKVRVNEALDRAALHGMDRIVCVSEEQARRVRRAGVRRSKVVVIRNAVDPSRYDQRDPSERERILSLFPDRPLRVVGAVGRLSPEKGYAVLVEAAALVLTVDPDAAFVHFGDGPLRGELTAKIADLGISRRFILAGFRGDLHSILPQLDLFVLPSFTEGLPVVVLEAFAAGVPVVATAVGGTPEVVVDGHNGRLVPPRDPVTLARRIVEILSDDPGRIAFGARGRQLVLDRFTFEAQSRGYGRLLESLRSHGRIIRQPVVDVSLTR